MVEHPAEYPWSSYHCNAFGENNDLIVAHPLYNALEATVIERCRAYRALFDIEVEEKTIEDIREATNKAWVLGSDYFKQTIEYKINRPMTPRPKGGDRKSKAYQDTIDQV